MQTFRALGALHPDPVPPTAGGFAPKPSNSPPIANSWLRAWIVQFEMMHLCGILSIRDQLQVFSNKNFLRKRKSCCN